MSFLVQILLPRNREAKELPLEQFKHVRDELTAQFGGVTVYSRASAEGLWKSEDGIVEQDEMVLYEVMTDSIEKPWWLKYRCELECRFDQTEIVIRAHKITRL